jgi:hypothetical protein
MLGFLDIRFSDVKIQGNSLMKPSEYRKKLRIQRQEIQDYDSLGHSS